MRIIIVLPARLFSSQIERTEIAQSRRASVLGSTEGWFGVDDPVFAEEWTQPGSEELGMGEGCEFSGQVQLAARWIRSHPRFFLPIAVLRAAVSRTLYPPRRHQSTGHSKHVRGHVCQLDVGGFQYFQQAVALAA
jgi:hypothetical protein